MKVIKRYNQHRRDLHVDFECEGCGGKKTTKNAYDDRNYWDNVVPDIKCDECHRSTNDLGIAKQNIVTKYPDGQEV